MKTMSNKIIFHLDNLFNTHGLPVSIQTDNAMNFNSSELNDYFAEMGIEHRNTTPLWPQPNGEVEVKNKGIMKRVRIAFSQNKNWKQELKSYFLIYRSSPHSITGVSPAELLFKRKIRTKLPELQNYEANDQNS